MNSPEAIRRHRATTLAALSDSHPVWCTLRDLLAEARDHATGAAVQSSMDPHERAYQCGYLASLIDLKEELERLRREGLAPEPES